MEDHKFKVIVADEKGEKIVCKNDPLLYLILTFFNISDRMKRLNEL